MTHPVRRSAHLRCFVRQLHHAAERSLTADPHRVLATTFRKRLRLPPNDVGVEGNRRMRILTQIFVPHKIPVSSVHVVLLNESSLLSLLENQRSYDERLPVVPKKLDTSQKRGTH